MQRLGDVGSGVNGNNRDEGLAYGVMLVINRSDQPPSPSARKITQWIESRPAVADDANAYLYLLGFSIEQNQDPVEWGKIPKWASSCRV